MSFSAHELLIFLRVRDEASRTLNRFEANAMKLAASQLATNTKVMADLSDQKAAQLAKLAAARAANKEVVRGYDSQIQAHNNLLRQRQKEVIALERNKAVFDKEHRARVKQINNEAKESLKLSNDKIAAITNEHKASLAESNSKIAQANRVIGTHKNSIAIQRKNMEAARIARLETVKSYKSQINAAREYALVDAKESGKRIRTLRANREAALDNIDSEIIGIRKTISTKKEYIRLRTNEINKLKANRDSLKSSFDAEVAGIKKTDIANTASTAQKISASELARNTALANNESEILAIRKLIAQREQELANIRKVRTQKSAASQAAINDLNEEIAKTREAERVARKNHKIAIEEARASARAAQIKNESLRNTGIAMTSAGAMSAAMGIVTVNSLSDAADASIKYRQEASRTFTQVDDLNRTSLTDIVNYGRDAASNFAVPLDDMQGALYDIYSSMETVSAKGKTLVDVPKFLAAASRAAVGGQTDVKTATNALIAIMNSYNLKAKDVGKVNDVLFQLVRKGVGDFAQLTKQMGIAGPSAKRAGASYKDTAAALAFMTRNGIKVGSVGTFMGRAFDALSKTKTKENMKELGINIYDAHGKMKPMIKVIDMMKASMKGLTTEQKNAKLDKMFTGSGGTIQAMRFFNSALNDQSGLYKTLQKDIKNASDAVDKNGKKVGAAQLAYEEMANTDASKILIAQNKMAVGWQKLGDSIAPIKAAIMEFFGNLVDKWNELSPSMRQGIASFIAISAVIVIVIGGIVTLIGVVMMASAAIAMVGPAAGPIIGIVLGIVAVIAGLAAAGYLLINNWDTITAFFKPFIDNIVAGWNRFKAGFEDAFKAFDPVWKLFSDTITNAWNNILPYFDQGIKLITDMYNQWKPQMDELSAGFGNFMDKIDPLITAIANFAGVIGTVIGGYVVSYFTVFMAMIAGVWRFVTTVFANMLPGIMAFGVGVMGIIGGVIDIFTGLFTLDWTKFISGVAQVFGGLVTAIGGILATGVGFINGVIKGFIDGIIAFFVYLYDVIVGHSIIPDLVNSIISWIAGLGPSILDFIGSMVGSVVGWFVGMGTTVATKVAFMVGKVVTFFSTLPSKTISAVSSLASKLSQAGTNWLAGLLKAVTSGAGNVVSFIKGLPSKISGALSGTGNLLYNAGKNILQGFLNGLKNIWSNITSFVGNIANWIRDHKGPISVDRNLLVPAGRAIMGGLNKSLRSGWRDTQSFIRDVNGQIQISGNSTVSSNQVLGAGMRSSNGTVTVTVNTQEINPVKHSADLGYLIASNLGY